MPIFTVPKCPFQMIIRQPIIYKIPDDFKQCNLRPGTYREGKRKNLIAKIDELIEKFGGHQSGAEEYTIDPGMTVSVNSIRSTQHGYRVRCMLYKKYNPNIGRQMEIPVEMIEGIEYDVHV